MRRMTLAFLPLLLLMACQRPDVEAFGRKPTPIVVTFNVSSDYPRAEDLGKEYAAALRAKLATRTMVVPAGVTAPEPSAELQVSITQIRSQVDPSPAAVGMATGIAVGALSALAGNRDAVFDGFFWGLWAGSNAAASRDWDRSRLGFTPTRVSALVRLVQRGDPEPLVEFSVSGSDVIDQMDPIRSRDRDDDARIAEEEAKAFARVVVERLQDEFHWLPLVQPSYFTPPETLRSLPPEPEPAPIQPPAPDPEDPAAVPDPDAELN